MANMKTQRPDAAGGIYTQTIRCDAIIPAIITQAMRDQLKDLDP